MLQSMLVPSLCCCPCIGHAWLTCRCIQGRWLSVFKGRLRVVRYLAALVAERGVFLARVALMEEGQVLATGRLAVELSGD